MIPRLRPFRNPYLPSNLHALNGRLGRTPDAVRIQLNVSFGSIADRCVRTITGRLGGRAAIMQRQSEPPAVDSLRSDKIKITDHDKSKTVIISVEIRTCTHLLQLPIARRNMRSHRVQYRLTFSMICGTVTFWKIRQLWRSSRNDNCGTSLASYTAKR